MPLRVPQPASEPDVGHPGATLAETRDADPPVTGDHTQPARMGRYTILRRLGEGGMGTVWSAYDESLDRRVAIKVLVSAKPSGHSRARMLREAKALARLNHPNVVQVFEVGELGDDVFVAMEFVRGPSLAEWLEQPRDFPAILDAFIQAGRGLLAVHGANLVHRDFKPHNVVVGDDGRVRLIDFGIARLVDDDARPTQDSAPDSAPDAAPGVEVGALDGALDRLTRTGQFVGTPAYMSPEQLRSLPIDARADQFGFCVALYRAVYRTAPFAGDKVGALALNVFAGRLIEPTRPPGVPARLLPALRRGLEVDPAARHPDMAALLDALESVRPRRARYAMWALGIAAVAGAGSSAALLSSGADTCGGGDAAIATVWNEGRAAAIAEDFARADAAEVWRRAADTLGGFRDEWVRQHVDACEVHRRGEQSANLLDRRMACLDDGKRELDALMSEFEQFEPQLVNVVADATAALPDPRRCGDPARLGSDAGPPHAVAARAQALSEVLARAQAQERAGRVPRARETLAPVIDEIDGIGWPELAMSLHSTLARLDIDEARFADAQQQYQQTFRLAVAVGNEDQTLQSAMGLATVIGVQQGRFADAEAWVTVADAWLARTGESALERSIWDQTVAGIREREGRLDEAERLLQASIARLADVDPGQAARPLATGHNALGFVYQAQRRYDEAEQAFLAAREQWIAFAGPDHPVTTDALNNLGSLYLDDHRPVDATRIFEQALAAREKIFGHDHPKVAHILHNLGTAANKRGDHRAALQYQAQALEILERTLGPNDAAVGTSLVALGESHLELGEAALALPYIERALAIDEAGLGPNHPAVAWDLNALAMANNGLARWDAARRAAERAIAIREEHTTVDRVGQSRYQLAQALAGLGRLDEARSAARLAIDEYAAEPANQATIRVWLERLDAASPP